MTNFISTNEVISEQACVYCKCSLATKPKVVEIFEMNVNEEGIVYACGVDCEEQYYSCMDDAYEYMAMRAQHANKYLDY